jgi:hypothetical protein
MSATLIDDPSQFPEATGPVNGDTFAMVRDCYQRLANRSAYLKRILDEGVRRIRFGSAEQMRAVHPATLSNGDTFLVVGYGFFLWDSSSTKAVAPPWVYAPLVGTVGRWVHALNALRGAPEGFPIMTDGRIADGQLRNGSVAIPAWIASGLNQTFPAGTGPTDVVGAWVSSGPCSAGDMVDVKVSFCQLQAAGIGSSVGLRIAGEGIDEDVPGLGKLVIVPRKEAGDWRSLSGTGRFTVVSPGTYTVRARVTAASDAEVVIQETASIFVEVIRP